MIFFVVVLALRFIVRLRFPTEVPISMNISPDIHMVQNVFTRLCSVQLGQWLFAAGYSFATIFESKKGF